MPEKKTFVGPLPLLLMAAIIGSCGLQRREQYAAILYVARSVNELCRVLKQHEHGVDAFF